MANRPLVGGCDVSASAGASCSTSSAGFQHLSTGQHIGVGKARASRLRTYAVSFRASRSSYGLSPSLSLLGIPEMAQSLSRLLFGSDSNPPPTPPGIGDGGPSRAVGVTPGAQPLFQLADAKEPVVLTLASFAVTKLAYVRLTKLFREAYITKTGVDVRFRLTFAGSGVQARAVIDGLPADLVALALALDIDKICEAGLIQPTWRTRCPNNAVVCETTVALVVRLDNPKSIKSWEDLLRPEVKVVMANPKTAGVARWIFLALWGCRMKRGDAAAIQYVTRVIENVVVQPRDAREASDVFYKQKVGDVLLTYENEVILTNQVYGDKALPYTIPYDNIRIECAVSAVDKVVEAKGEVASRAAAEFTKFLFTTEAQREFAKVGFRVNPKVSKSAAEQQVGLPPAKLWSVEDELGGWQKAQAKFFDAGKILDVIQTEVAVKKMDQRKAEQALAAGRR